MPARIMPEAPGISIPKYSVVGKYTTEPGSKFAQHVALTRDESTASRGIALPVWEMGPPHSGWSDFLEQDPCGRQMPCTRRRMAFSHFG